ncbi:MAG: cold shock domain-containing protein [Pseudomonadota bacterium]
MINTERHAEEVSQSEPLRSSIKWFNTSKGFGFAVPDDDPCDAFIHITTLQDAGIHELGEGAVISCHIVKGPKGALVTKVDKLIEIGENPAPITFRVEIDEDEVIETMEGTVKWYKPDKGFGFIIPEDGKKDVFVHKTCLDKKNMDLLIPGQKITMKVRSVSKGREVLDFEVNGSE